MDRIFFIYFISCCLKLISYILPQTPSTMRNKRKRNSCEFKLFSTSCLSRLGFFQKKPISSGHSEETGVLPEETWKKVSETSKCQLGTITKFAVEGFLCILIQYYRFGGIFTLNCNKILHFPLKYQILHQILVDYQLI